MILTVTLIGTAIVPIKAAIEPLYESKEPFAIFSEIARAVGIEQEFTMGKTAMELIEDSYEVARQTVERQRYRYAGFRRSLG